MLSTIMYERQIIPFLIRNVLILYLLTSNQYFINSQNVNLEDVLSAFEKSIDYVSRNKDKMNIDAMVLIAFTQSNINHLKLKDVIKQKYWDRILNIENKILDCFSRFTSLKNEKHLNSLFTNTIGTSNAWNKPITFLNNSLNPYNIHEFSNLIINTPKQFIKYLQEERLREEESDSCLKEIFQQHPNCCTEHICTISPMCEEKMGLLENQTVDRGYGLTHNLLYLQIARSQRCKLNETFIKMKIEKFCSVILWELKNIEEFEVYTQFDDLILEQVTLCGYEGFSEFFTEKIIKHILSIQNPLGCFGVEKRIDKSRKKRETHFFKDGCTDHTTGLGVSTLSLILRFLLK